MSNLSIARNRSLTDKVVFIGLCILLFYPPFFRGLFFNNELLPTHIFSFALFAVWIGMKIKNKDLKIITNFTDIFAMSIILLYFISIFYGVNKRLAVGEFLKYSNYFLAYLLAKEFTRYSDYKKIIINVLLVSSFGVALVGIGSAIGTWNYNGAYVWGRINSTLQYPNALAAYMGAMFFMAIGLAINERKILNKAIYLILSSVFIFTLILTFSRGMWLLMPLLILIYIFAVPKEKAVFVFISMLLSGIIGTGFAALFQKSLQNPSRLKLWFIFFGMIIIAGLAEFVLNKTKNKLYKMNYKILYILLIVFVSIGLIMSLIVYNDLKNIDFEQINQKGNIITKQVLKVLPDSILWRFKDLNNQTQNVEGRVIFYKDAFKIIKDYPVLGTGGGGWTTLYFTYQSFMYWTTQAHNYFLKVWIEIGTLGMFLFIAFIFTIIQTFYKYKKQDKADVMTVSIFLVIISLLAHSAMDFDLSLSALSIVLWTFIGIFISKNNEDKALKFNKKFVSYTLIAAAILLCIASTSLYLGTQNAQKGIQAAKSKDLEKSIDYFKKASSFDPVTASYRADLGELYKVMSKKDEDLLKLAKKNIDKAVKLAPYDPKILGKAASFYLRIGRINEAKEFADQIVKVQPMKAENYQTKSKFYFVVANHLLKNEEVEKAEVYIDGLLNIEKEFKEASARSLKPMKMTDKTKEYIQNAKKLKEAIYSK